MEKIQPIKKRALYREEIKGRIKSAILSGQLMPGDRIIETKWAKELGVSQSPVREAIRELEVEGLIENIPYQGSFVRQITRDDLHDSYLVRMALEGLGIEDACRLINEEQLACVKHCLDEMRTAASNSQFDVYIQFDTLFHSYIMEASNNRMLKRLWKQCNIRLWTHFGTKFSIKTLDILADRHEKIYLALLKRDKRMAVREIKLHFQELIEEL